ncbi:MAG TPA: endonuclease/exonuclease/phosphatase family protein [Gemmataceae bacterium]|nr:endonuclease/exonuclease/phosphatase family protein [Gemmataceae bacterium]
MRLLSYNIHKGIGNDRRYRMERIIRVIEEENPDLICLQEVTHNHRRSRYHDQPRLLANHFGAAAHFYQMNVPLKNGGYGNLVLSRWPFRVKHQVSLRLHNRKPRGAQCVVVETPEGPLHLVNWHLGLNEKERHWQVRHLLNHHLFRESAHLPTVIAGDFNDWRNTLAGNAFAEHAFELLTAPASRFRSFPSFLSMMALDKVFARGPVIARHARVVRSKLARRASDHLPVVLDFHLATGHGGLRTG